MNTVVQSPQLNNIYQLLNSLNINELEAVMQQIIGIRKQKMPNVLSETETDLLKKINIGIPNVIQKRYDKLLKNKAKETLSEIEYNELLELTSYIENHDNQRLKQIIALAQYRNQSLDETLISLEIKPRLNVC
jgi:hypothetical protein